MGGLQKHYFDTGVSLRKYPRPLSEHEENIGGVLKIAFYTEPVPEGSVFLYARDHDTRDSDEGRQILMVEIKGGGLISEYAFFWIPKTK